jgi:hypothetical protein
VRGKGCPGLAQGLTIFTLPKSLARGIGETFDYFCAYFLAAPPIGQEGLAIPYPKHTPHSKNYHGIYRTCANNQGKSV